MLQLERVFKEGRQSRALLGLSKQEFLVLEQNFERVYEDQRRAQERKRVSGWGRKGILRGYRLKLLFILGYLKKTPAQLENHGSAAHPVNDEA